MRKDKHGRNISNKGTYMHLWMMQTPAWRALSPTAQMLFVWLKLEFKGNKFNNNGRIRLSYRQAAERLGVSVNTASKAFHQLQEKGFIVVTQLGSLGVEGMARGPMYELTDLPLPGGKKPSAKFALWTEEKPFQVVRHKAQN